MVYKDFKGKLIFFKNPSIEKVKNLYQLNYQFLIEVLAIVLSYKLPSRSFVKMLLQLSTIVSEI